MFKNFFPISISVGQYLDVWWWFEKSRWFPSCQPRIWGIYSSLLVTVSGVLLTWAHRWESPLHVHSPYTQTVVEKLHHFCKHCTLQANIAPYSQGSSFFLNCSIFAFSRYMNPSLTWSSYPFPPKPEKNQMVVSLVWSDVCFQYCKPKAANVILSQECVDLGFKVTNSFGVRTEKNTSDL